MNGKNITEDILRKIAKEEKSIRYSDQQRNETLWKCLKVNFLG